MALIYKTICSKESYEALPSDNNIVIEVKMMVDGESFINAGVINDYKDLPLKELMDEIEAKANLIAKMYSRIFVGREELRKRNG